MTAGPDLDALTATGVPVHAEVSSRGGMPLPAGLDAGSSAYVEVAGRQRPALGEIAACYRGRRMACVVFTLDAEAATGQPPVPNEEAAQAAAACADVIIPFASIAPARGRAAPRQARRLVTGPGVRGFTFHPSLQGCFPGIRLTYSNPMLTGDVAAGFPRLTIKPAVREEILRTNAAPLPGLTAG